MSDKIGADLLIGCVWLSLQAQRLGSQLTALMPCRCILLDKAQPSEDLQSPGQSKLVLTSMDHDNQLNGLYNNTN